MGTDAWEGMGGVGWSGWVGVWMVAYPTPITTSTASIDGVIYVHILNFFCKNGIFL